MNTLIIVSQRLTVALLVLGLAGCGLFKFGTQYDEAEENRPLDIPPDLNEPDTRGEVTVPPSPAGNSQRSTSVDARPQAASDPSGTVPVDSASLPADNARVAWGDADDELSLMVFDQIDSVWRRTGFALERAGFVIDGRDEARRLYQVAYEDSPPQKEGKGFFGTISGWFSSDDNEGEHVDLSGRYNISLIGEGANTRVVVLDSSGNPVANRAARNMLVLLHERLS